MVSKMGQTLQKIIKNKWRAENMPTVEQWINGYDDEYFEDDE